MTHHKFTNRLIGETSPYLLQHAHNPVQWYPWGAEALSRAVREDKPILLSIGYSACHWCHVMEHESFEDEDTAQLMNENFVNIKVDREERPDLDSIYMAAVQMATGSGGWPMTVFLTPDQVPFFCGTYFPPEDRHGMPGFRQVLVGVAQAYREKRTIIRNNAQSLLEALRRPEIPDGGPAALGTSLLDTAAAGLIRNYDSRNGGFGSAPKFPPSMALSFLMKSYARTGEAQYLQVVNHTLTKMAHGGLYDQLGGGFHRYSVDAQWLVPHFEKMLYDNALLSRAYVDGYLLTGNKLYRQIAEETLSYIVREMTSPEGGFYSSQDADSEGEEGKFFLWTVDEVRSVLGEKDAELICRYFDVTPKGNFEGKNILHIGSSAPPSDPDAESRWQQALERGRGGLFKAREARMRPGRDEKILAAWNGLALRSFAEAANALDREDFRNVAVRNAEFLLSKLYADGRLRRSYKDGHARFNAYLEDYACLIDGLISLYEATFDARWVRDAEHLARQMIERYWDPDGGGFFFTSGDHESLIHRPKEFYDNATPSGNSVAAGALLRLWKLTGLNEISRCALSILEKMAEPMAQHPAAFPHLLCALDFYLGSPREIAVIGDARDPGTRELLNQVFHTYLPNRVVACGEGDALFLLKDKARVEGRPTAYICENFSCGLPVTAAEDLRRRLKIRNAPPI